MHTDFIPVYLREEYARSPLEEDTLRSRERSRVCWCCFHVASGVVVLCVGLPEPASCPVTRLLFLARKIDELGGFWLGQLGQVGVSCFISARALKQPCSDPKIQLQFFLRGAISCDCMTEGYKGWCYVGYPLV